MTPSQMGWPVGEEVGESAGDRDGGEDGPARRSIAPMISAFIRSQWSSDMVAEATARGRALERTWRLDQERREPDDEGGSERRDAKRIKQIASGLNDMRWYVTVETAKGAHQWERRYRPLVADDPPRLRNVGMDVKLGQNFFSDEHIPQHESGQGFVFVMEKSWMWRQSTILPFKGSRRISQGAGDGQL